MKKLVLHFIACLATCFAVETQAQTVTFSEPFTSGVSKCPEWTAFQTALNPGIYTSVTMKGSLDPTGFTCNDPTIVNAFATAVKNSSVYISPVTNGHVWHVCNRYQAEVWIDPPASCSPSNCPNPGYLMRPCFGTTIWGGINSNTCGTIAQTMTLEFNAGPPCPAPTALSATNILSTTATLSWAPVSGTAGYEYVIDQNAGNPTGAGTPIATTTVNASSLLPGTNYFLHVRNKCVSLNISQWIHLPFTTLPPCNKPSGFHTTNLLPTSTTINWNPLLSALNWDYIIDNNRTNPTTTTGATNVTQPTDNVTGLTENTWYYVHIRANCTGEQSDWSLDSFKTPIPCRAPEIKISNVNVDEAVAYWESVPSAFEYEYAVSSSPTPPAAGTRYISTSLHTPVLKDGKDYYVHVRAQCNSLGTIAFSPWATANFRTWPTAIQGTGNSSFDIDVYPNPASDLLTVELKGNIASNATVTISDVAGRVLRTEAITNAKTTLNIATLPAGNYLLKYADGENNRLIKLNKK